MKKVKTEPSDIPKADYGQRQIWLDGRVSARTAFVFESILKKMNSLGNDTIRFFICGEGGDFYACLKILNLIKFSTSKFVIVAFTKVRSGCFLITQAENCEKRLAVPGTKFIFHHAVDNYSRIACKNVEMDQHYYEERKNRLQVVDAMQLLLFTQRGRPVKKILELFNRQAQLNVKIADELNLIDGIFDKGEFDKYRRIFIG